MTSDPSRSSPLARNLRPLQVEAGPNARVFNRPVISSLVQGSPTLTPDYTIFRLGSYPRLRGVYGCAIVWTIGHFGSSPLARGLPPRACRRDTRRRDHPRSRGVYPPGPGPATRRTGSSPLARGLRRCGLPRPSRRRIIPARAGFTDGTACEAWSLSDHPRSRGVYIRSTIPERYRRGSSPLARGLQIARPLIIHGRRIIPARAGFTRRMSACP